MDYLNRLSTWLNQRPWLNLVFLALATASIAISFVLYLRTKRERRPCYSLSTFRLVQRDAETLKTLEIRFAGSPIKTLSVSRLSIWNQGAEPIEATDLAPKDPIAVTAASGAQLLDAQLVETVTRANNFSILVDKENSRVVVKFDYFSKGEGVVIDLYHTGAGDDAIRVSGTVKGARGFVRLGPNVDPISDYVFGRFMATWPDPDQLHPILRFLYFLVVVPIFMPPFLLVFGTDQFLKMFRRVPKRFNVQSIRRQPADDSRLHTQ